jgi:hypothetical protein
MIALVCIAKNEDRYIDEWIDYHKKLGFDEIFVYQNDWESKTKNEKARFLTVNGQCKQTICYNLFLDKNRNNFDWAAFLDVDEFMVLKKHDNIGDFLKEYEDLPALGINWYLFGDNGHKGKIIDYSTIKRFTKRGAHVDQHIKSILNLRLSRDAIMDIHNPNCVIGDTNKKLFNGPYNPDGPADIAQINHYLCKTKTEFVAKCQRGVACLAKMDPPFFRSITEFDTHNLNEIEDMTAYHFMYGSQ